MRIFVESVTTYFVTGKTRKGSAIQSAVKQFKHVLLFNEEALTALLVNIERLVDTCNKKYRGSMYSVHHYKEKTGGRISVRPKETGTETPVATLEYAYVVDVYCDNDIKRTMADMVRTFAPDIYDDFKVTIDVHNPQEGGAR